jgi:hypothetical protein
MQTGDQQEIARRDDTHARFDHGQCARRLQRTDQAATRRKRTILLLAAFAAGTALAEMIAAQG